MSSRGKEQQQARGLQLQVRLPRRGQKGSDSCRRAAVAKEQQLPGSSSRQGKDNTEAKLGAHHSGGGGQRKDSSARRDVVVQIHSMDEWPEKVCELGAREDLQDIEPLIVDAHGGLLFVDGLPGEVPLTEDSFPVTLTFRRGRTQAQGS